MPVKNLELDFDIKNVFMIIQVSWIYFIYIPLAFILISLTILVNSVPQYEVKGMLVIGQSSFRDLINLDGGDGGKKYLKLLEEPISVVTKLNSAGYRSVFLISNHKTDKYTSEQGIFLRFLRINKIKDSNLIEFSSRLYSREYGKNIANDFFKSIIDDHDELLNNNKKNIQTYIAFYTTEISKINKDIDAINNSVLSEPDNVLNVLPASVVLQQKYNQLGTFTKEKFGLEFYLNNSNSFNTQIYGVINISDAPIYPNYFKTLIIALLTGFFVAFFFAYIRHLYLPRIYK
jgi:capsular polysaccharide biosynthesis protein